MPDESRQWRTRPVLSVALTLVTVVVPVAISVAATRLAAQIVPRPQRGAGAAMAWWVTMLGIATVVVFAIERVTRRLAPLAALLKLSLVFPDRAPSRFSVALRSGTVRQLRDRYETVKRDGLGATPAEAARTVVELIAALNAHDHVTRGHCERVRAYTVMIAEELKLPAAEVDQLRWAGLLHDLGKLEVPSEILNKKGELDEGEWEIIKTHPAAGARIAAPLADWLGESFRAIEEHHERWDGGGYPHGLAGDDIAFGARIVAVADAFDVMTAARSYKRPNAPSWARAELVRCAGSQFDPVVVRAFVNLSLGRLRWAIGPLSWLAQLPLLAQGPITAATGTLVTTAMAASVAVGASTLAALPVAADAAPVTVSTVAQQEPLDLTGTTLLITSTTSPEVSISAAVRAETPRATSTTPTAPSTTRPSVPESTSTTSTSTPTTQSPTNNNQGQSTVPAKSVPAPTAPKASNAPRATKPPRAKATPKPTNTPRNGTGNSNQQGN